MILITGGAGYIGSHCAVEFLNNGFDVLIFDNFSVGHREIVENIQSDFKNLFFIEGDLKNKKDIDFVFKNHKIDAVIHFAAYSQVAQSVKDPKEYYENNVIGTINLLSSMVENNVLRIIFSSTAATYGEPKYVPIDENHPQSPINPYGRTKLMIENIMDDYDKAYGLKSIRLRYFNVIGANYKAKIGEWHNPETHLVPNILKSDIIPNYIFHVFGDDYPTKDGTCVRDYVDVEDLAVAHRLAYNYLAQNNKTDVFNLGSESGYSVKEIYDAVVQVLNKEIPIEYSKRREGDPAVLLAKSSKAKNILNWTPKKNLSESIKNAYEWEKILSNLS